MQAMATPRRGRVQRGRFQTAVVAALVLLALGMVPYSARNAAPSAVSGALPPEVLAAEVGEPPSAPAPASERSESTPPSEWEKTLLPYRRRAADFVKERCPNDPEMLLAAGLLTNDAEDALSLLKRAVDKSDSPAAWAAYVTQLIRALELTYERPGTWGMDPEDEKAMAEFESFVEERNAPRKLDPAEAAPVLEAIADWERADPENAMPLAAEVVYLYGLHEDEKALARWRHAAGLPVASTRMQEHFHALARLLHAMGMSDMQAIQSSYQIKLPSYSSRFRTCARIAWYEGRLAQMEGRADDAIAWWNSTIAVGRHIQESANTMVEYLVGSAVEAVGAQPAWKWYLGVATGMKEGPLLKGRYFWGPQHEFYVSQVGEAADAKVRDSLVKAKVRSQNARKALGELLGLQLAWTRLLTASALVSLLVASLVVLFAASGSWRRRQADEATLLSPGWRAGIVVVTVILAGLAATLMLTSPVMASSVGLRVLVLAPLTLVLCWLLALLLPLLAPTPGSAAHLGLAGEPAPHSPPQHRPLRAARHRAGNRRKRGAEAVDRRVVPWVAHRDGADRAGPRSRLDQPGDPAGLLAGRVSAEGEEVVEAGRPRAPALRAGDPLRVAERAWLRGEPAAVDALVLQVLDLRVAHVARVIGLRPAVLADIRFHHRERPTQVPSLRGDGSAGLAYMSHFIRFRHDYLRNSTSALMAAGGPPPHWPTAGTTRKPPRIAPPAGCRGSGR